jgi:transposase
MGGRCNRRRRAGRAGVDCHKSKKGSKIHLAVDTLGNLLTLLATPANEQERAQVAELVEAVQEVTGEHVEVADVDQGYTGADAAEAAEERGVIPTNCLHGRRP